jgi:hypothetical protein
MKKFIMNIIHETDKRDALDIAARDAEVRSNETSAERLRNALVNSNGGLPKRLRRRLYKSV